MYKRQQYNIFLEKLWSKDLNTSNYRYIDRVQDVLGLNRGPELIVLGNATEHPQYEYLLNECEARGITRRSAESRRGDVRIGHGLRPGDTLPMTGTELNERQERWRGMTPTLTVPEGWTQRADNVFTAPETGMYEVHTPIGVHYGQTQEEATERAQAAEADRIIAQHEARIQAHVQSEEREEQPWQQQIRGQWR